MKKIKKKHQPLIHPSGRRYRMDGHTHTLACGHAYNTLAELAKAAKKAKLDLICWTEHGPEMPGSVSDIFFSNFPAIPPVINGVRVLKGMEANIMDYDGTLDASERIIGRLEILSASLHTPCITPGSMLENTDAVLGAIKNPNVDFCCHLGNPQYPVDYKKVVKAAKKHNKLIEINNGSFFIRTGSKDNCVKIAEYCVQYDVPIIVGSDTHWADAVGQFPYADRALTEAGVPDELIINLDPNRLLSYLREKGRRLGYYRQMDGNGLYPDYTLEPQDLELRI